MPNNHPLDVLRAVVARNVAEHGAIAAVEESFDFRARYSVEGYRGIAFYAVDYVYDWTEESWTFLGDDDDDVEDETLYAYDEPEQVQNRQRVQVVMVGDDRIFEVDVGECTPISEDDYCSECGQIGCTADGR